MKNMKKFLALILLFSGFTISTFAQTGTSTTASSSATIITPIGITKDVDMAFGNIAVNTNSGTVVMTAASPATRTPSGGVTLPAVTGTVAAAEFTVTGQVNSAYTIGLPTSATITGPGSNTMTVNSFTSSLSGNGTGGNTGSSGSQDSYVGATLNVGASQVPGTYTGTFTVTVNYN